MLSAAEQKMSAAVGVPESFVARKAAGQTVKKVIMQIVYGDEMTNTCTLNM